MNHIALFFEVFGFEFHPSAFGKSGRRNNGLCGQIIEKTEFVIVLLKF